MPANSSTGGYLAPTNTLAPEGQEVQLDTVSVGDCLGEVAGLGNFETVLSRSVIARFSFGDFRFLSLEALIEAKIEAARKTGAAVAAQQITDTIKESSDSKTISRTLDRAKLWSVQTPQTFRVEIIRRAIAVARQKNLIFTDDTAACELIGHAVQLVPSVTPNPKVTVPGDLPFIETLLKSF